MTTMRRAAQGVAGAETPFPSGLLDRGDAEEAGARILTMNSCIAFGPFRLLPAQRLLLEGDTSVRIGSRALDILITLVESAGTPVSKDELTARTWPSVFVDDGNLRVHIAALRKALRDGEEGTRYLETIPGRGYCFVAPVEICGKGTPALQAAPVSDGLPGRDIRIVGCTQRIAAITGLLSVRRLITLVGPGGIGKTMVALAVARGVQDTFEHKARFVDLAGVAGPADVPAAIAASLRFIGQASNPVPGLLAALRDKRMLIVLDGCDRVVDAAADIAVEILKAAPGVRILATSREPLRTPSEAVQRLAPLSFPDSPDGLTAAQALAFPAVRLFVERAAADIDGYTMSDGDVPTVVEICRSLDGNALAIELAASCVDTFGVGGLTSLLDGRFRLSMRGQRSAAARHQSLAASLDWSYATLSEHERAVLRRLSVVTAEFTFEEAEAVARSDRGDISDAIADLVAKSLIRADVGGPVVRYRLHNTTRIYARQKLAESGELDETVQRWTECREQAARPASDTTG